MAGNQEVLRVLGRFRTKDDVASSPSVLDLFSGAGVSPLHLSPAARFCLARCLSLYVSVFSVHYVKETLKKNDDDDSSLRFSSGPDLSCSMSDNPMVCFDWERPDSVVAADIRTYNLLGKLARSSKVTGFSRDAIDAITFLAKR